MSWASDIDKASKLLGIGVTKMVRLISLHIFTGVVLKKGGDDEQRRIIGSIAKALGLKSFEQDGRELKDIPQPQDTPKAPPIENAEPAAASSDTH